MKKAEGRAEGAFPLSRTEGATRILNKSPQGL